MTIPKNAIPMRLTCGQCGKPFLAIHRRAFCSHACYRARQRAVGGMGMAMLAISKRDILGDTNGLCLRLPGPCTFTDCRLHLASPDTGVDLVRQRALPAHLCAAKAAREVPERTVLEVAEILGVSRQAVHQAEQRALVKLRRREEGSEAA